MTEKPTLAKRAREQAELVGLEALDLAIRARDAASDAYDRARASRPWLPGLRSIGIAALVLLVAFLWGVWTGWDWRGASFDVRERELRARIARFETREHALIDAAVSEARRESGEIAEAALARQRQLEVQLALEREAASLSTAACNAPAGPLNALIAKVNE